MALLRVRRMNHPLPPRSAERSVVSTTDYRRDQQNVPSYQLPITAAISKTFSRADHRLRRDQQTVAAPR
jgi:hypothetical protein